MWVDLEYLLVFLRSKTEKDLIWIQRIDKYDQHLFLYRFSRKEADRYRLIHWTNRAINRVKLIEATYIDVRLRPAFLFVLLLIWSIAIWRYSRVFWHYLDVILSSVRSPSPKEYFLYIKVSHKVLDSGYFVSVGLVISWVSILSEVLLR